MRQIGHLLSRSGVRAREALVALALCALGIFGAGCAGPARQLHPLSGDEFSVFAPDRRTPPPPACKGSFDERCACFTRELEQQSQSLEVGGAFAIVAPDGELRSFVRSDALNQAAPITPDTRFPAASVTKMFLAAAAVALSQEGLVDLQQPISRYVPELASAPVGSTSLHQLLTHTSGLGSPPQCEQPSDDLADVLSEHASRRLLAPPGAVHNYSNLGYAFVAIVLERVTGQSFEQVVRSRVLVPAGIPGARFGFEGLAVRGHAPDGAEVMPRCRAMWPSGGLVLSIRELAQWARVVAHPGSSRLEPLVATLIAPHVRTGERFAYGYGVQQLDQSGALVYSHGGRLENFTAFVGWSHGLAVAAFANSNEPYPVVAGYRALSTFLSLSADWQGPPGPAHGLGAYPGLYVDPAGTLGRLRVSREGDGLMIDYPDGDPSLLPASFRFVFEPGAHRARYVVTPIGVGERRGD